ncbi:carboxymuconolactone decarboxylase family protein [Streptomyces sp. NPDC094472]|uniref:carboxymuconolactone decarboxylase family protein n=1 Tax=Streptomyces sp. NPDC094472 TaxID=3155080 RepID=UPI00332A7E43
MPRLPQIQPAEATGAAAEALAQVRKTLGSVPNLAKVMANSPALVKGWLAPSGALSEGVIPAPVRERLAIATAQYNNCEYCLSAHTYIGAHVAKVDTEELERARDAESSEPHSAALLGLSGAIAGGRGSIDERQLKAARAASVTDTDMAEVVGNLTAVSTARTAFPPWLQTTGSRVPNAYGGRPIEGYRRGALPRTFLARAANLTQGREAQGPSSPDDASIVTFPALAERTMDTNVRDLAAPTCSCFRSVLAEIGR